MSSEVFVSVGADGTYKTVSPAFERITGYPPEKVIGQHFRSFVHPDDLASGEEVILRLLAGESIHGYENRHMHHDGSFRWLKWSLTMTDGELFCIGRDVTDEKLSEDVLRQSQKMEAVGQLTGGIAHDFNNLLMAITGSLDLIGRRLPEEHDEKLDRYLAGAQAAAKRAAALTHRLLAFSRRQPLAPKITNVNTLVDGMHDLIERTIGSDIEVVVQTFDGAWPTLCDAHQLESGLLNLLLNSRDAMPNGGTIVIRTNNVAANMCSARGIPSGEYVKIAVQDNGMGMDETTKAKAFDPFFTTKPVGSGTGLGLSMLYGFIKQSGGHIRIESEAGKGASVLIYLPRSVEPQESFFDQPAKVTSHPHENAAILLVEDEEVIRSLVSELLTNAGYKVYTASEANEALKIVSDIGSPIDLLVTDVGLPGINGKQLAEIARTIRPHVPILFITGYAAGITLRQDLVMDGADMILKPISMDALQNKIAEMLAQYN